VRDDAVLSTRVRARGPRQPQSAARDPRCRARPGAGLPGAGPGQADADARPWPSPWCGCWSMSS